MRARAKSEMASLLVVDDDHGGRVALCKLLSRRGHQVTGVPSGDAALASFFGHVPDAVILDLCMPGMDGGDLLRTIRSQLAMHALPVIVFTGHPDGAALERARDLKVSAVLVKGVATLDDILRAVDEALIQAFGRPSEQQSTSASSSGAVESVMADQIGGASRGAPTSVDDRETVEQLGDG